MEDSIDFLKKLQEDNTKLVQELLYYHTEVRRLNQENKQLREALKKCSPYNSDWRKPIEEKCSFCGSGSDWTHTEDCEYIKLTEVQE